MRPNKDRNVLLTAYNGQRHLWSLNIFTLLACINPSFTKPFGTHTFYQGGGGMSAGLPCYLKNRCAHEREILSSIKDIFERPRNV